MGPGRLCRLIALLAVVAGGCDTPDATGVGPEVDACLVEPDQGEGAWLTLAHFGETVTDGLALKVECGPQGAFMINVIPSVGGFDPDSEWIEFDVSLEVPGFNLGPGGMFYGAQAQPYYVGCDEGEPDAHAALSILVPDGIFDIETLDRRAARLRITARPFSAPPLMVEYAVTLAAENEGDYFFCYGA
jgi:hypothetical protein